MTGERDRSPPIVVPDLCRTHQILLVEQCGYGPNDTWRALMVVTQIALFQGATCDADTHQKIGDDITQIGQLGCLACWKPDRFGQIVQTIGTSKDIGKIKKLGESWLEAARATKR